MNGTLKANLGRSMRRTRENDTVAGNLAQDVYAIKKDIFCCILAGMVLLGVVYLFSVFWMYRQQDAVRYQEWKKTVEDIYNNRLSEAEKNLRSLLLVLRENPTLQQQFMAKDREKLLEASRSLEHSLSQDYHITHFYFQNAQSVQARKIDRLTCRESLVILGKK
ncbi:MAG: hypothetical protein D3909_15960, partial [Candidatus Electrothrix sp. ATG1]|nr:hypothetical protein [Candidatus Electrothrix sp. ATG1]